MDELVGQEGGGGLAQVVVEERSFRNAVVAGLVMLQSEVGDAIAQRQEKPVGAVVTRAEERPGFRDEAVVGGAGLGRDLQRLVALRGHLHEMRDGASLADGQLAKMSPANHGRIHQRLERDGLEQSPAPGGRSDRQGGPQLPSGGERQARLIEDVPDGNPGRIDEHLIPVDRRQLGRGGSGGAESFDGGRWEEKVEGDLQLGDPRGDFAVERIHFGIVPLPGDALSSRRELQAGQIGDGAGGAVLSGDPFRVMKRHGAGLDGDHQFRVEDLPPYFGSVEVERHGLLFPSRRRCGRERADTECPHQAQDDRMEPGSHRNPPEGTSLLSMASRVRFGERPCGPPTL
jgi:hypothetical protein